MTRALFLRALFILLLFDLLSSCRRASSEADPTTQPATTTPTRFAEIPEIVDLEASLLTPTPVTVMTATPLASETPAFPTSSTSVLLLTTTPDRRWQACEDAPPSRLHVGERAYVSYDPYLPNRVRLQPVRNNANVLGQINPGESVDILDGPVCNDQAVWWRVKSLRKDLEGWTSEGDHSNYWLAPTDRDAPPIVPLTHRPACPVDDESFCAFVHELERWITRGDIDEILTRTQVSECAPKQPVQSEPDIGQDDSDDQVCAYWGVLGSGLGGADQTQVALINASWFTYASPQRRIDSLLIPPFTESYASDPFLPQSPAILITTGDPTWDWMFFFDRVDETWTVTALIMVAKDTKEIRALAESSIPWP